MMNINFPLSLLVTLTGAICMAEDDHSFKITTKGSDDRVEATSEEDKVVFVIHSPKGISSATIERIADEWPDRVVLQLRLKGLEGFKASNETRKLEASVSSANREVRLWKDGKEDSLLNAKSPYWMEIRILDCDGMPTKAIPLEAGYFEMQLPKKFFEDNPKSFSLNWIDFYRN